MAKDKTAPVYTALLVYSPISTPHDAFGMVTTFDPACTTYITPDGTLVVYENTTSKMRVGAFSSGRWSSFRYETEAEVASAAIMPGAEVSPDESAMYDPDELGDVPFPPRYQTGGSND